MREFKREQKTQKKAMRQKLRKERIHTQGKYASFWIYLCAFLCLTVLSLLFTPETMEWVPAVYVNMLFAALFILKGVRARRYGIAKESGQVRGVSKDALQEYSVRYGSLLVLAGAVFLIVSYLLQMEILAPWPYFGIMTALCGLLLVMERRMRK